VEVDPMPSLPESPPFVKADPTRPTGFGPLRCPVCGQEATVSLDLDDLQTFRCGECDDTFSADDVRIMIADWKRVLDWIALSPKAGG
jgi:hypothetical protein